MNTFNIEKSKEIFKSHFNCEAQYMISSPGRVELGGNHTDHQQGRVMAAAIDLDIKSLISKRDDNTASIVSEGFGKIEISLDMIDSYRKQETSQALTAGVAKAFLDNGLNIGGFNAYLTSTLPCGGGLSSSASFEVLIGSVFNALYNDSTVDAVKIAKFGQYAENEFFGKPSGLMDQLACAVGGINAIDFEDIDEPKIEHIDLDFSKSGYSVYVISSGADHTDLTCEYASITEDMAKVSGYFGKSVLRQVSEEQFFSSFAALRDETGDMAVMRAMHFYAENTRVSKQAKALRRGEVEVFLNLANESGRSSWMLLQNVLLRSKTSEGLAVTLAVCENALDGIGMCRVHGGGFGGAALVIIPTDREEEIINKIETVLGSSVAVKINIRNRGPEVIRL